MDDLSIKHLKPRKDSHYHQGVINPADCKKYLESASGQPVIYRSGLELQFIKYCETTKSVKSWASECIKIPYYSRLDKKQANYYPDYIVESQDGRKTVVEIKPYGQTVKPRMTDSMWLKQAWIRNVDKWKAAKEWCKRHDMTFMVITEKFFG